MRKITEIIIHCSATIEGKDYTVADIDRWHRARGFRKIAKTDAHPRTPVRPSNERQCAH